MNIVKWWRSYRADKKALKERNSIEWKRENLTHFCPYADDIIFKYKCTVNGLACTAFDCYVDLPSPKDATEQAEYEEL